MRIKGGMDGVMEHPLLAYGESQISRYPDGKAPFYWTMYPRQRTHEKTNLRSDLHAKGFAYEKSNGYPSRSLSP